MPRGALEAVALEAYRDGTLTRDEVGHLLSLSFWETLGVLDFGARRGLLDLPAALDRLERTTFRASPRLLRVVRERHSAGRF